MPKSSKPRKKYRPNPLHRADMLLKHQPWKVSQVFATLDGIMHAIETEGELALDDDGVPMFRDPFDQCWYPIGPSLRGMCDAYDIHCRRQGKAEITEGLRNLYTLIEEDQDLSASDLKDAHEAIAAMKRETMNMTSAYATQIVRDAQVKFSLDDALGNNE